MSEHSKLPRLSVGYMNQGHGHGHYAILREESEELFANVPFGDKALATQVVLACNAHDALVKACEEVLAHEADCLRRGAGYDAKVNRIVFAALAQAKGE